MDTAKQNPNEETQTLRKQLALAVRGIQWSYAIFWSISSKQPGMMEWCDGYYNGEIKTRKTVQAAELNADQLGLQRSEQLRELYESLSIGETNPQAKRPTAALIPEDLTNAEWYFLVCMSFNFEIDQELPGKTIAKNDSVWLCNADRVDTKVFSRSLLAKSAAIQTIVCFPHFGGVVELGTTELVQEDLNLIRHVKANFLESSCVSNDYTNNDVLTAGQIDDQENILPEDDLDQLLDCPNMDICSPNNCSNEFADNLLREGSNVVDGVDGETASEMLNWQFMDDAISNCLNNSANSSDCVSQSCEDPETIVPVSAGVQETQECDQNETVVGSKANDIYYQSLLSNLLKSSDQLILGPYFVDGNPVSSFVSWSRNGFLGSQLPKCGTPQRLLKKVLIEVPRLHELCGSETGKERENFRQEADDNDRNHVLSERKRREKMNERFLILGSLIPSGGKVDKVSILDHTIEYLKELERRAEELESYKEAMKLESMNRSKPHDAIERTSDNYGPDKTSHHKKSSTNKRKVCETDNIGSKKNRIHLRDSSTDDVGVEVTDKDVSIEISCPWKESLVLGMTGTVRSLRMDILTMECSNIDGILSMTIKAQCKGLKAPSANVIRQALQMVISQELKKKKIGSVKI